MSEVKTIKGVDEGTWSEFKTMAAKSNVNMGELLKTMVKNYEKSAERFWKDILKGEKLLSDKEARELSRLISKEREKLGFRI